MSTFTNTSKNELVTTVNYENNSYNLSDFDEQRYLESFLGKRYMDMGSLVVLSSLYCLMFMSGVIGNVFTCVVIARNRFMHTATNYYLFSLAISDVMTLILGLPPELYSIWEAYPWRMGKGFCIFKSFISEMTSYASVLTITAFTIERYIAICHPMKFQSRSSLQRAIKIILFLWLIACCCALPYPFHTKEYYFLKHPHTGEPLHVSLVCSIPDRWRRLMSYFFQISTFLFFVFPMTMITIMYILIGVALRNSEVIVKHKGDLNHTAATTKARKAVLKMLVAVVVAFFACWAPFHSQRLMTIYIEKWTDELLNIQTYLFYISGTLYFVSSTVNPIVYNLMSRKYRRAFKRTLCCCLMSDEHSLDVSVFGSTSPQDKKQNSLPYSYSRLPPNKGRVAREPLTVNTCV